MVRRISCVTGCSIEVSSLFAKRCSCASSKRSGIVIVNLPCPSKTRPVTVPSESGSMRRTLPEVSVHVAVSRVIVTPAAGSGTAGENCQRCSRA